MNKQSISFTGDMDTEKLPFPAQKSKKRHCQSIVRQMSDNYPLFVSSIPAESGYLRVPKSNNNRNMKQIICILALLLTSVTTTKAQTSPTLTEEKQPIEFANIALLSEDSTFIQGTCSRSDGSFELLPPAPGNYLLQISSIGYKPFASLAPPGVPTTGYCKPMPCYSRQPSSPPPAPFSD